MCEKGMRKHINGNRDVGQSPWTWAEHTRVAIDIAGERWLLVLCPSIRRARDSWSKQYERGFDRGTVVHLLGVAGKTMVLRLRQGPSRAYGPRALFHQEKDMRNKYSMDTQLVECIPFDYGAY